MTREGIKDNKDKGLGLQPNSFPILKLFSRLCQQLQMLPCPGLCGNIRKMVITHTLYNKSIKEKIFQQLFKTRVDKIIEDRLYLLKNTIYPCPMLNQTKHILDKQLNLIINTLFGTE